MIDLMHLFMALLLMGTLYISNSVHAFRTLIHNNLILYGQQDIKSRACSMDKKFVTNSAEYFSRFNDTVVNVWCPVLIGTFGAIGVTWILHVKGYDNIVMHVAIAMLVSLCIIFQVTHKKLTKYLHCWSMYMVVAYDSSVVENIVRQWEEYVVTVDDVENLTAEQVYRGELLVNTYKNSCNSLITYAKFTDDPIIKETVAKTIVPLRSKSEIES